MSSIPTQKVMHDDVSKWLSAQNRETRNLLATRFACRVIPLLIDFTNYVTSQKKYEKDIFLIPYRAVRVALSASIWPHSSKKHLLSTFRHSDLLASTVASGVVASATMATKSILTHNDNRAKMYANSAFAYADNIVGTRLAHLTFVNAFNADRAWVDNKPKSMPITEIYRQPLWPKANIPQKMTTEWQALKSTLLNLDENWQVWVDWYEDRLAGKPLNQELELAVANLDPEKYWNKGAAVTNAKIQELIEEHTAKQDISPENLQQLEFGTQFEPSGGQFVIRAMGEQSDFDVAQRPDIQRTHGKLKRKAADFSDMAIRLSNQYGWANIGGAAQRFESSLRGSTLDVAKDIRNVWEEIVELGSFLEQDDDVRKNTNGGIEPLDPNYRRTLADLLQAGAPWLREFPTAQELDDNIRKHKASDKEFDTAKDIITSSGTVNIISQQDVETLLAFAESAKRGSVQSEKAKASTALSGKNITIAVAALYFAQVVAGAGPNSILVQKGVELYLQSEKAIVQMFQNGPADIRAVIQALLKELSEKENPPITPNKPKQVSSKKDEDE